MKFEWDPEKEKINITKHGINFKEASTVFDDERYLEIYDYQHSVNEDRYIVIGKMGDTTIILYVVYTERGDIARIISARKAKQREKEGYYNGYYQL